MSSTPSNYPSEPNVLLQEKPADKVKKPSMFHVLLHNDDYTTMEFVINVLMNVFHKTFEDATKTMLSVHHQGKAVAGTYTREIAETKIDQVETLAKQNNYPLKATCEEVS